MTARKVYVIESDGGATKIGMSFNPKQRCANLQRETPNELRLVHVAEVPNNKARDVEKTAHGLLHPARIRGEWFAISAIEAINAIDAALDRVLRREAMAGPGRVAWVVSIHTRPADRAELKRISREERMSVATIIGLAVEAYVTARSTA